MPRANHAEDLDQVNPTGRLDVALLRACDLIAPRLGVKEWPAFRKIAKTTIARKLGKRSRAIQREIQRVRDAVS